MVVPFLAFPILLHQLHAKTSSKEYYLRFELFEDCVCNFTRSRTEVNFPSADWLKYLRIQLNVFVGGVFLRSKTCQRRFLETIFFTKRTHFKELQVKENLFHCPQIWTVGSLINKMKPSLRIFHFQIFFLRGRFLYDRFIFF